MKNLQLLYKDYLNETGLLSSSKLGKTKEVTADAVTAQPDFNSANNTLLNELNNSQKFNNRMLMIIIAAFVILFSIGVFLIFKFLSDPKTMGLIFGGTFLSLLTVITAMQKLWKEKNTIDMLVTLVPNLPKEDTAKVIETLYYSTMNKK